MAASLKQIPYDCSIYFQTRDRYKLQSDTDRTLMVTARLLKTPILSSDIASAKTCFKNNCHGSYDDCDSKSVEWISGAPILTLDSP